MSKKPRLTLSFENQGVHVIWRIVCFCVELLTPSGLISNFRQVLKVKVKVSLSTPWEHTGRKERSLHSFLTLVLGECEWLTSRHGRFTLRKESRYPLNRRLISFQSRLGVLKKRKMAYPYWDSNLRPPSRNVVAISNMPSLILYDNINWRKHISLCNPSTECTIIGQIQFL